MSIDFIILIPMHNCNFMISVWIQQLYQLPDLIIYSCISKVFFIDKIGYNKMYTALQFSGKKKIKQWTLLYNDDAFSIVTVKT